MRRPSVPLLVAAGTVATLVAGVASLGIGVYRVPLSDVVGAIVRLLFGGASDAGAPPNDVIVLHLRLPRAVGAVCAGAALGTSGAALQALLRNPLASPFVIGTAQAAGFGAVLAIALGLGGAAALGLAFGASVTAALLVLSLSRTQRSLPTESVVLTGLSVSLLFGALMGLVRYAAHDEGVVGRISVWMLGGLWRTAWGPLASTGPAALAAVVATCLLWRRLDLLALGEEHARRLGVRAARTGTAILLLTCVMTSLAVLIAGVVAFVGLIVPHAARKIVGPEHSLLLPASAFLGALLVLLTDTVARTAVPPQELPLGVVTSLVGVPAFLVILRSLRARRASP